MPIGAVLLAIVLGACGSTTTTATPTRSATPTATAVPTPPVFFPARDTPYDHASKELQTYWAPYTVGTIPGVNALADQPPAPRVVNLTTTVPDDVAQAWGDAFMHTAAWEDWAIRASQPGLMGRLGIDAQSDQSSLAAGDVVTRPGCDLFPVQLILLANTAASDLSFDQYSMGAVYQGPNGTTCDTTVAPPGAPAQIARTYTSMAEVFPGWVHSDPILGDLWIGDSRDDCGPACTPPATAPAPITSAPAFPADDTRMTDATAALQAAWTPYDVTVVPGESAVTGVPTLPPLDNETHGVVSADMAATWELGLFTDLAWQRWVWRLTQIEFLPHVISTTAADSTLRGDANNGAHADLPACAAYPETVRLAPNTASDLNQSDAASTTQYHFDLTFARNCTVTVFMTDGSSTDVTLVHTETLYGDERTDPLLGAIWYPLDAVFPDN